MRFGFNLFCDCVSTQFTIGWNQAQKFEMPSVQEIRLSNFRCFRAEQSVRMTPLTFLVGENSTGKTSFLAAMSVISDFIENRRISVFSSHVDFRYPYDLGAFSDMVHHPSEQDDYTPSFEIGINLSEIQSLDSRRSTARERGRAVNLAITFGENSVGMPYPVRLLFGVNDCSLELVNMDDGSTQCFLLKGEKSWKLKDFKKTSTWLNYFFIYDTSARSYELFCETIESSNSNQSKLSLNDYNDFRRLFKSFEATHQLPVFAGAPIRSNPRRTYEPIQLSLDPEGSYVPTLLANLHDQDKKKWKQLKKRLESFGRESGLFNQIQVKRFGGLTEPFQLQVKNRIGRKSNLIDVGYGVSQILPILTELFRTDEQQMMYLFQQPEVHLHPSAQAALGNLFCDVANSNRQIVVETHSDFILDRVRYLVRQQKFKSNDVSIIYFEQKKDDVKVYNISVDRYGNLENTPPRYRSFFLEETNRVLDFEI